MALGSPPYDTSTLLNASAVSICAGALLAAAVASRTSHENLQEVFGNDEDLFADPAVVAVLPSSAFAVPHLMIAVLHEHDLHPLPLETSCSLLRLGYATTISLEVPRAEWERATRLLRDHGFEKYLCPSS
ncbi:MAG: hypothetical protein AAF368_06905 [Planctomycetota bacterium]